MMRSGACTVAVGLACGHGLQPATALARPARPARRRSAAPPRGFTLVEVCVAVAIMAMASAVMIPAINNLGRAELRRASRQVAANVRRCFDEAALTGQTYRMVFTLTEAQDRDRGPDAVPTEPIAIEASELTLAFSGHDGALAEASDGNDAVDLSASPFGSNFGAGDNAVPPAEADSSGVGAAASASSDMFRSMFGINRLAKEAGRPSFDAVGAVHLPHGVRVSDVWLDGMHEASAEGSIALVFFPTGYTQHARIHLEDDGKNIFTLEVEPLTGRVSVQEGYMTGEDGRSP